jgi:hypothetical protein
MKRFGFAALALLAIAAGQAAAQDKVKAVPVLIGLLNPSGLVAEPGTTHLLVADSGAGRILCFHTDGGEYEKVITKFAKDVYGKGPMYDIGPLGLAFAGKGNLIVGGGDQIDGKEVVYVFKMPPHGSTITADKGATLGPIPIGHKDSPKGEGNFFNVAVTPDAIFVSSNGDDTKGWILKAEGKDGKYGELKCFIATKPDLNVDAPTALTVDSHGHLVVGQMGEVNVAGDSLLAIYDPKTGKLITSVKTGLSDLVGLAYKAGKLYGIDFSWADPKNGGLYRIDLSGEDKDATVKTEKLCSLDKPAAMAFGNDGKLYIAEFGTQTEEKNPDGTPLRPGRIVMIEGDL